MQTRFTETQLSDPDIAASDKVLRACVHCGFCIATCPTYVLLGDELDSPRGRIYLIKQMFEQGAPATAEVVQHLDRCLSCLACMSTCPSGVNYQHLIDHARVHVERSFRRPWPERLLRAVLAFTLPSPARFRAALKLAAWSRPLHRLLPGRLRAIAALAPARLEPAAAPEAPLRPAGKTRMRVALLKGCVQSVLAPRINAAARRVLERAGAEVVPVSGCCGAIVHHLGREHAARAAAAPLIRQLDRDIESGLLDAVVVTASGCGTHAKDYGWLFRNDAALGGAAARVSAATRDVTEILQALGLPRSPEAPPLTVAYHSACSMQHGQKLEVPPRELLRGAGFRVVEVPEGHLCCGSAGTYNLLQPEIAGRLRERKLDNLSRTGAQLVATGNIGCITQLTAGGGLPIVHTVELLDWAGGGPRPATLAGIDAVR
jgi:glycolate oxidase iron-sulfur subunit